MLKVNKETWRKIHTTNISKRSKAKQIIVGSLFVEFWMNFMSDGWWQKSDENCDVTSVLTSFLVSNFQHSIFFILGFFSLLHRCCFFFVASTFSFVYCSLLFYGNKYVSRCCVTLFKDIFMNECNDEMPSLKFPWKCFVYSLAIYSKTENGVHLLWIFIFATSFSLYLGHQVIHANHAHEQNDSFTIFYSLHSCIFSTSRCVITKTRFIHFSKTNMWNVPNIQIFPVKYYFFPHLVMLLLLMWNVWIIPFYRVGLFFLFIFVSLFYVSVNKILTRKRKKIMANFR